MPSPAPAGVMPCGLFEGGQQLTLAFGAARLGFVASSTVLRIDILTRQTPCRRLEGGGESAGGGGVGGERFEREERGS